MPVSVQVQVPVSVDQTTTSSTVLVTGQARVRQGVGTKRHDTQLIRLALGYLYATVYRNNLGTDITFFPVSSGRE
jgi:hypothetical protein